MIVTLVVPLVAEARLSNHLHVLLAIDTDAGNAGIPEDLGVWSDVLAEIRQGREDRVSVTVARGRDLTPEAVVGFSRSLGQRPDWALLFIYSGHGAADAAGNHFLTFTHGRLARNDLRLAMEGTGSNLQVILTDCCGTIAPFTPRQRRIPAEWAMFEQLFFEAGGMVDILGSEVGSPSLGFPTFGGLFTNACTNLLCSPVSVSDRDGDGRVTWPEFFRVLRRDTQRLATAIGEEQNPSFWYLGGRSRLDQFMADARVRLAGSQARIAALEARAEAVAAGRSGLSTRQAIREMDSCRRSIAGIAGDVFAVGRLVHGLALAAQRTGLVDREFGDAATAYIRDYEGTVVGCNRAIVTMDAWSRQAAGGLPEYCH